MGMQDRDWYREHYKSRQNAPEQPPEPKRVKARRARPVFFVHYLAGFWPGLIVGLIVGFTIGVLFQGFA